MILAVPAVIPVAMPVDAPIVAMAVLPLLHVPPGVALLRVVVLPWQMVLVPVMAGGEASTVNVIELVQPDEVV